MLLPHEIKKKEFSHAMGGYARAEVKSYLEYISGQYDKLRRENDDLTRKLEAACARLDEYQKKEAEAAKASEAEVKIKTEEKASSAPIVCGADAIKRIEELRLGTVEAIKNELERLGRELSEIENIVTAGSPFEISNDAAETATSSDSDELGITVEEMTDELWASLETAIVNEVEGLTPVSAEPIISEIADDDEDAVDITEPEITEILEEIRETREEFDEISDEIEEIIDADEIETPEEITVDDFTDLLIVDGADEEEVLDLGAEDVEETEDVINIDTEAKEAEAEAEQETEEADSEETEEVIFIDGEEIIDYTELPIGETEEDAVSAYELYSAPEGDVTNVLDDDPEPIFDEPMLDAAFEESLGSDTETEAEAVAEAAEAGAETEAAEAEDAAQISFDEIPEQLSLDDILSAIDAFTAIDTEADEIFAEDAENEAEAEEVEEIEEIEEIEYAEEVEEIEEIEEAEADEADGETSDFEDPDIDDVMELFEAAEELTPPVEAPKTEISAYPKRVYRFRRGRKSQSPDDTAALLEALKLQYSQKTEIESDSDFDIKDYDEFNFTFADTDDKIDTVPTQNDINDL